MSKKLQNLHWKNRWTSHLGCIKGCLNYLNLDVSDAWLFGATGHAFIINIGVTDVCPSGPTAWNTGRMCTLGRNIGYDFSEIFALKHAVNWYEGNKLSLLPLRTAEDFSARQKEAWDFVRGSINEGMPCYGWELEIPEFYVVLGYDDIGYHYSGPLCDSGKGPKPWQELGDTDIGVLEMYSVRPGQAADDAKTVKEALEFALEHAKGPEKWFRPNYRTGLAGFEKWIEALENGTAGGYGMAYNAAVWTECRGFGAQFLREARGRLNGEVSVLLEDAAEQYGMVFQHLQRVADLFPFPPGNEINNEERRNKAVVHLQNARDNEESGLELLGRIAKAL